MGNLLCESIATCAKGVRGESEARGSGKAGQHQLDPPQRGVARADSDKAGGPGHDRPGQQLGSGALDVVIALGLPVRITQAATAHAARRHALAGARSRRPPAQIERQLGPGAHPARDPAPAPQAPCGASARNASCPARPGLRGPGPVVRPQWRGLWRLTGPAGAAVAVGRYARGAPASGDWDRRQGPWPTALTLNDSEASRSEQPQV